uniref:VWFA domain-containing protein n=1 Tax=Mola mola TaxID=94237 RepID=A0A3Q3XKF0_MOLML
DQKPAFTLFICVALIQIGDCKGATVADIVFIVDESTSIGNKNFQLVRSFLSSIVSGLEVGLTNVRVGIATYNDTTTARAYLNTFHDKEEILQFIKNLPYNRGGTKTGAALDFARKEIFIEQKGRRKGVQQVAVVITDGESQDDVTDQAKLLRRTGVTVFAVGIQNASKPELDMMASHPPERHVFIVKNFTNLRPMQQLIRKMLCRNIIDSAIRPETDISDVKEGCTSFVFLLWKDEADFFFLIDDSGSIDNEDFYDMKKFINEFLHTFRIGPQYIRMGLAKYADLPSLEFDLTTHTDAKSIEEAVEKVTHEGGGTMTGAALSFMKAYFNRSMVSRGHRVPEYLIVITDGKSADNVKTPAEELRAQGATIYAVGVKNASSTELLQIAGDPKRTVFVGNFDALKSINKGIITDICTSDGKENELR